MTLAQLPNALTWFRLLAAPLVALLMLTASPGGAWLALGLFVVAALTDFADGYLARKLNVISALGTMLDPIADKVMVVIALAALCARDGASLVLTLPVVVILFREVFVSGLREYLGQYSIKVPVTQLAKWKTTLQLIAIGVLLAPLAVAQILGMALLWVAAIVTAITGWQYYSTAKAALE